MSTTKSRESRKTATVGAPFGSALLLVTIDFRVLGWRGNVQGLVPALSPEAPCNLPNGPTGSAIRLLIDGVERGQLAPETVLDVPASAAKLPLRISMMPIQAGCGMFAILVDPVSPQIPGMEDRIRKLEEQLRATEECLRTTIEEYEAATEELKCSYEELRSANEQLQLTAEELQDSNSSVAAARDRFEAVNRNLQVHNTRIQRRLDEYLGLFNSLGHPVILLGNDLRLRFFNRPAERLLRLMPAAEGLHLRSLESSLDLDILAETCASVLDQLQPAERTIGQFTFQIRPLITPDGHIEGVLLLVIQGQLQ